MIQMWMKSLNIRIESQRVFEQRSNHMFKIIGALGMETKSETTIEIGIEIGEERGMVTRDARMIIRSRVVYLFHQAVITVNQGWRLCFQRW